MQKIMAETADKLARETNFVQRGSKLAGSKSIQILNPQRGVFSMNH